MDYIVVATDGNEYGPVSLDVLKQRVRDMRVVPTTMLKAACSGQAIPASSVAGLFPAGAPPVAGPWSQPPSAYPWTMGNAQMYGDDGKGDLLWAIARSALAIVFFFVLHGIGLAFAIYAVAYAVRAQQKGHRHGPIAIAISGITLVVIVIGWALRLNGGGV